MSVEAAESGTARKSATHGSVRCHPRGEVWLQKGSIRFVKVPNLKMCCVHGLWSLFLASGHKNVLNDQIQWKHVLGPPEKWDHPRIKTTWGWRKVTQGYWFTIKTISELIARWPRSWFKALILGFHSVPSDLSKENNITISCASQWKHWFTYFGKFHSHNIRVAHLT